MTTIKVDSGLVAELDLGAAIRAEVDQGPNLIPHDGCSDLLAGREEEYASWLTAKLSQGLEVEPASLLLASKSLFGVRPIPVLDLASRTLYRALVDQLAPELIMPLRGAAEYREFREKPFHIEDVTHVVLADIAAFYQYVDHGRLYTEIINRTGKARVASATCDLLGAITGREFGLPQNHGPSHILADCYLDVVERRLIRSGVVTLRYNDDFLLPVQSWEQARLSLHSLERACEEMGLTLNDSKTFHPKLDTYASWVTTPRQRLKELAEYAAAELTEFDRYGDVTIEPDQAEVFREAAVRILDMWSEEGRGSRDPMEPSRDLVGNAINVLTLLGDDRVSTYCRDLLAYEPHLTPNVAEYLASVPPEDAAEELLATVLRDNSVWVSDWQTGWLLNAVREFDNLDSDSITAEWVRQVLRSGNNSDLTVGLAMWAAAVHRLTDVASVARRYDALSEATRPLAARAIADLDPEGASTAAATLHSERPPVSWIIE